MEIARRLFFIENFYKKIKKYVFYPEFVRTV